MPPDMHNVRSNHTDERKANQVGKGSVRRAIMCEMERGVWRGTPELRATVFNTQNLDQRANLREKVDQINEEQ